MNTGWRSKKSCSSFCNYRLSSVNFDLDGSDGGVRRAGEKSICLLKSNYRPLLLHQLLNLLNSSVTFCPLPPAKRLCQRTKFAEMRGSVCKIGEQRKKDVSILRSSQMLNYCHFYRPFVDDHKTIRLKCAKLRYKKMHHSSPRRVWKAKAKD